MLKLAIFMHIMRFVRQNNRFRAGRPLKKVWPRTSLGFAGRHDSGDGTRTSLPSSYPLTGAARSLPRATKQKLPTDLV
jgi:hypothetical protein